jgi:hypothetical protein
LLGHDGPDLPSVGRRGRCPVSADRLQSGAVPGTGS